MAETLLIVFIVCILLGMPISYEIVTKQHGGTIEVSSTVGDFTEFVVCLPRGLGAKGALTPST